MHTRQRIYLILTALALVAVWLFCWFAEGFFVLLSTYPQGYVIGLLVGVAIAYPTLRPASMRQVSMVLLASFTIALFSLNFAPPWVIGPSKTFMMFYKDIHSGMNMVAVNQALDQHFPVSGELPKPVCQETQKSPTKKAFSCVLDPNQGAYNAEIITVYLTNDRVTHKEYSPD
jgi:hypothetical protein